jgi:hypothetical protein
VTTQRFSTIHMARPGANAASTCRRVQLGTYRVGCATLSSWESATILTKCNRICSCGVRGVVRCSRVRHPISSRMRPQSGQYRLHGHLNQPLLSVLKAEEISAYPRVRRRNLAPMPSSVAQRVRKAYSSARPPANASRKNPSEDETVDEAPGLAVRQCHARLLPGSRCDSQGPCGICGSETSADSTTTSKTPTLSTHPASRVIATITRSPSAVAATRPP